MPFLVIFINVVRRWAFAYIKLLSCRKQHKQKLKDQISEIRTKFLTKSFEDSMTETITAKILNANSAIEI